MFITHTLEQVDGEAARRSDLVGDVVVAEIEKIAWQVLDVLRRTQRLQQRPGRIDATLHLRKHVANIEIAYDREQIVIAYKSSENLDYTERRGRRLIHDNYLGWIQNLVNDVRRAVHNAANG